MMLCKICCGRFYGFHMGELRSFIHLFIAGEDAQARHGSATGLTDGDVIRLIPNIAGG